MAGTLYNGIGFPFEFGNTSFPKATSDNDLLKDSLVQVITTARGERLMRPEFGSGANDFVFQNNNALLERLITRDVSQAIAANEPRVIVQEIQIDRDDNKITVTVIFVVRATGQADVTQVEFSGV